MNPVAINLGGFDIRWYSILILVGVIIGFILANRESTKLEINKGFIFNMMFWTLIIGIIGARLYYCIFNWSMYKDNPIEILMIWNGGLAIHGGLLFGLITSSLYCKRYDVRLLRISDIIVPSLILAQAIGRWGNFFNQEAHGAATTALNLKALFVPQFVINGMTIDGVVYFPTFFFESVACLAVFILLIIIRRNKYLHVGTLSGIYLLAYGAIRFFIEISRTDSLMLGGFKVAQIVSVIMFIIGLGIIMINSRKGRFEDLYNDSSNSTNINF